MKQLVNRVLILTSFAGLASASSISLNFTTDRAEANTDDLTVGESAGAPGYVTAGWNNLEVLGADGPYTGTQADVTGPTVGVLSDDIGGSVATTLTWGGRNTWFTDNTTAVGSPGADARMMGAYLDNSAASPNTTVGFANIPYSEYVIVAYFGSDANGRSGTIGVAGTDTYSYSSNSNLGGTVAYTQTTDTAGGNPSANYAVWEGQTASSFDLTLTRGSGNSGLHGIQIIQVPEPSVAGLFVLSGLALLRRRRH